MFALSPTWQEEKAERSTKVIARTPSSRWKARYRVGTILAVVTTLTSGCGVAVVDNGALSEQLQVALTESIKVEVGEVNCPSGVRTDFAQRFSCSVEFPDQGAAKVQVQVNPQPQGLPPLITIERFTPEGAGDG